LRDSGRPAGLRAGAVSLGVFAAAALGASSAGAAGGGSGGGAVFVGKPEVGKVVCLSRCASRKRAQGGSTVRIDGEELGEATSVVFMGSTGRSDDISSKVRPGSATRISARVPVGAVSGPVSVLTASGGRSAPSRPVAILPPPPPAPNAQLTPAPGPVEPGAPVLETGTSRTRVFVGARRAVAFSYRVQAAAAVSVQVDLVRASDGLAVKSWTPAPAQPGKVGTVVWSGSLGGAAASPGRYSFRLTAAGPGGGVARSAQLENAERDSFDLYDHVFPVRGKHDFGGPGARFGSGRSGHSHQGHDVFARCGTPLKAARGGRVQYAGFHGSAGYYLVIDGTGTGEDTAYMHLEEPSPFRAGDRVYTGQRIGAVGDSGNARGCHLHFEIWSAPGWYEGGRPIDPLPALQAWDAWS
jgi:murein DD-endopeptidase MepM/ murein hydrolase activator NlpD